MNKCTDIENKLSAYFEGDVSPQEQRLIEEHLATCRQCSKALEDIKKTMELVRNLEEIETPPWFKQKIMEQVREEAEKKTGILQKLFFPLHIKIPVEVFATCLVVVMAVYVFKSTSPEIKSLQTPSEQAQIADYPDKQKSKVAPSPPSVSKEKTVPEEGYKKDKAAAPQAMKKAKDVAAPREVLLAPAPAAPILAAPPQPGPARPAKEEAGGKSEVLQSAPSSVGTTEFVHKKKEDIAATDTEAQYRAGRKAAPNKLQLKASVEKKQQIITITVGADNAGTATGEIETMLNRLSATNLKQQSQESIRTITATLPSQKLKELYEKLKTIGDVKENVLLYNIPEGDISVRIEIVNNN